ncbi:LacI family DNA-binding transcriptional regulator [Phytomonospora sp. NPDC050363]|uniref:LacI family DNA-binding transcriptional regulator n=1 Tax=Phytomonospora sp. NPDC050363 TaxID=3155642 RepID=UPI00340A4515
MLDDNGHRPTLDTVAARAGVGRGTVSRVINGSPKVSEQAREAVLKAIRELGYVPNQAARSLVRRRTDTVALVVSESEERLWSEPYFASIIRGISKGLADTGLQLLLTLSHSRAEHAQLERYLAERHVDGLLLVSVHGEDTFSQNMEQLGLPIVLCGVPVGTRPVSYVDADNRGGARQAVEYLVGKGRRKIATIAGSQDMQVGVDRLAGYRDSLRTAELPDDPTLIAYGDFSEASGMARTRELLERHPDLDAIFTASDPMAFGAMRVLRDAGRRVPDDVAIIGFDDSPTAAQTDPPLTTVHQPAEAMGREMARLLVARIRGEQPDPPVTILSTKLVVRDSA